MIRRRITAVAMAVGAVLPLGVVAAPGAQARPSDCDGGNLSGYYDTVYSRSFYGRTIELRNASLLDIHSKARLLNYRSGDLVWIDRSLRTMPLTPKYPGDNQVRGYGGGWKQCGPFGRSESNVVRSWHFAVRACFRPAGGPTSECGPWYIDQ
ncbi:hypothetical protein ACSCBZ_19775 [Streptomyces niveiscabiei]|uniref:Secreted protein n=1 Tax=Streptomyces niveiscabiei TaxID=164115 RepID=A0ABW9I877_9ACTN|nr:hypothetical protein [Streptomyces niveiscabiei]